MNIIITIINSIYSAWTWLSLKTRIALVLLVICAALFIWFVHKKNQEKAEVEKQLQQWVEIQAEKDAQKVAERKEEVKRAEENTNQIRNANYSNLSDDELKRRIIEGVKKY